MDRLTKKEHKTKKKKLSRRKKERRKGRKWMGMRHTRKNKSQKK